MKSTVLQGSHFVKQLEYQDYLEALELLEGQECLEYLLQLADNFVLLKINVGGGEKLRFNKNFESS